MKTNYEHRSNIRGNSISLPIRVFGIVAIVLVTLHLFFPLFLSNLFTLIVSPFWHVENGYNVSIADENVSRELQTSMIQELQKENYDLKSIVHRNATTSKPFLAYIIKKPPFSAYDIYIIDIGKDSDLQIGDKVYAIGDVLLGEIAEINGTTAKVRLYSSYGEKYDVLIGKNNIQTIATGQGGGAFEVVLPKDVKIQENDIVVVPDISASVFGIVKKVNVDPARAFSTIFFSQPVNIYEQKWVLVYGEK